MKNKYLLQWYHDDELYFNREYETYQSIVDDFPIFENSENVRTWKRMTEKNQQPKYKKSQRYKYFKITKLI